MSRLNKIYIWMIGGEKIIVFRGKRLKNKILCIHDIWLKQIHMFKILYWLFVSIDLNSKRFQACLMMQRSVHWSWFHIHVINSLRYILIYICMCVYIKLYRRICKIIYLAKENNNNNNNYIKVIHLYHHLQWSNPRTHEWSDNSNDRGIYILA